VLTDIVPEIQRGRAGRAARDAGHHQAAHPLLALTRAHTRARRPGSPGAAGIVPRFRYGMYGVWYAIGVTETWCR
jgi:hypothetical protein